MKIEFVNHASVIFHHEDIHMICDPWLKDPVFHDGWNLIAESKFTFDDFEKINYIWFSHEHPDHFYPPNIKNIDEKYRKNITILFQETTDKKVIGFLKKLNFKEIIELKKDKWYELGKDFKILCNPFDHDSWLCVKHKDITVLNTNDCVIDTRAEAKSVHDLTGDISVLLTQFSYGQYEGNKNEPHKRKQAVEKKFKQIDTQITQFKPKYLLPMASFIYFCHEENYYMNDEINKVGNVYDYYKSKGTVEPVVLYMNESWDPSQAYTNSERSIAAWNQHYEVVRNSPKLCKTNTVALNELLATGEKFTSKFSANPKLFNRLKKAGELNIYLTDHDRTVSLSWKGLQEKENQTPADIEVSSDVLQYCTKFDWGFNTTHVNGRIQFRGTSGFSKFVKFENLSNMLNHHDEVPGLATRVVAKFKKVLSKVANR
ncbi:MBL fold metallo-hydrolase [Rufibacter roseus]|uniref:MBL fold metallo-hydrolase n=1 Tax=Rufibacter roseus TaxID=1567108 RepID=A0ABW2DSB4_9BACT|nr:MBL fold metallo-hydrolase [Rufibacter roseus]